MRVLVACEESQRVCIAFRERGHEAYSCDIQDCSGGHPEWHIKGDALSVIQPDCTLCSFEKDILDEDFYIFQTQDGKEHSFWGEWDLMVAHPPCTYLSAAGAVRLYPKKGEIDGERYFKGVAAREFFLKLYTAPIKRVCIENPVPLTIYGLPKYSQIIQPFDFGEEYSKKTCLWLKNLPPLFASELVRGNIKPWVSGGSKDINGNPRKRMGVCHDAKIRSKTFWGIAKAMAEQWG